MNLGCNMMLMNASCSYLQNFTTVLMMTAYKLELALCNDPRGEYLENYRCADGSQKLNISTRAVYVTQLSDALIIQLNIFKYSDGISKKAVPNLSTDEEISFQGNRMVLSGIIYHEGEQSHCGYYTSAVKVNNTCFLISDTGILRKQKLLCS